MTWGLTLLALGAATILLSWAAIITARPGRGVSGIPFFSGVVAASGVVLTPGLSTWFAIVPIVVDPFSGPILAFACVRLVRARKGRR